MKQSINSQCLIGCSYLLFSLIFIVSFNPKILVNLIFLVLIFTLPLKFVSSSFSLSFHFTSSWGRQCCCATFDYFSFAQFGHDHPPSYGRVYFRAMTCYFEGFDGRWGMVVKFACSASPGSLIHRLLNQSHLSLIPRLIW